MQQVKEEGSRGAAKFGSRFRGTTVSSTGQQQGLGHLKLGMQQKRGMFACLGRVETL
jgi:hypothetical protein